MIYVSFCRFEVAETACTYNFDSDNKYIKSLQCLRFIKDLYFVSFVSLNYLDQPN